MFENLTDKLQRVFKSLRGQGTLTEENITEALREIRVALLEADVNLNVARDLIEQIRVKAIGAEVLTALSPSEQVVKIGLTGPLTGPQAAIGKDDPIEPGMSDHRRHCDAEGDGRTRRAAVRSLRSATAGRHHGGVSRRQARIGRVASRAVPLKSG